MLHARDQLADLRESATRDFWNRSEPAWFGEQICIGMFPVMKRGSLDPFEAQESEYLTS